MRWTGVCYRAHSPRWAFAPTSGEGAAVRGARFNPKGVRALYLALSVKGVLLETDHGLAHRFDPLTICSYSVDKDGLIDLRTDQARAAAGVGLSDMSSAWFNDLADQKTPASWSLSRRLIEAGASGVLTPSFARGARPDMANLVLWKWGADLPHKVEVIDPEGRLPKDQASWR